MLGSESPLARPILHQVAAHLAAAAGDRSDGTAEFADLASRVLW